MAISEGSAVTNSRPYQVLRLGAPFLQSFRIEYGPPGLLGRFFLNADQRLKERGVTLGFASFDELAEVHARH
jgi:hypothetical protein